MKIKLLFAGAVFLLSTVTASAVPAKPVKKTVCQADGTLIELTLRGDEHYSFYTSEDGTPHQLKADGQLLKMTREEVSERWTELRAKRLAKDARRANARMTSPKQAGTPGQTTGKHRGLVILVEFADVKMATPDAQATFSRFFNEEGYHEYENTGSVRDYFLKQSYGQLEIDFDVVGPYSASGSLAYYGAHDGDLNDVRPTEMVMEAIDQAAKDVDFSNYDWDNDGEVDQVFLICAGYDEAEGADGDYIWPHEWSLGAQGIVRRYNGKKIDTYGVATELWGNGKTHNKDKEIAGIGTACHEFSHCLGLPDFYDTQGGNFGMGYWSVMDQGNYLNNSHTPAGYSSYERMFAGWLTPTELKEMTAITDMKPLATTPEAYILYNDANKNEFFLLENRQAVDFDAKLYGHGLLVLHVDYSAGAWTSNTVNNNANRQRMTIIPADGNLQNSQKSYQGDPFPGSSKNTALANYTTPASTLYNANVDGGYMMNKDIDNITESKEGLISFVACRPALSNPEPDNGTEVEGQNAFTIKWPAVKDAVKYEVQVTSIGTAAANPAEALEQEYTFDKFETKSVGFADASSKMSEYGLGGWSGSKLYTSPNKIRIGTSSAVGYIITPWWRTPQSSELTVVMGADVFKAGTKVKGTLKLAYGNEGDRPTYEERPFELTVGDSLVFNFQTFKDLYRIEIYPESQMYLNYLAIYDGTWTAEQLGITNKTAAREHSPRKATTIKSYVTDTNSITLKDLDRNNRYLYKVRSVGEAGNMSVWSDEKTFVFSESAGISRVTLDADNRSGLIYDLQGRCVGNYGDALRKGIYIIGGKKVVK